MKQTILLLLIITTITTQALGQEQLVDSNSLLINKHAIKYIPNSPDTANYINKQKLKAKRVKLAFKKNRQLPPVQKIIDRVLIIGNNNILRGIKWKKASHLAGFLPEIRISAGVDGNRDEHLTKYQTRPDQWGAKTYRDFGLTIMATWKLNELIFNRDELSVQRALEDLSDSRQALVTSIIGYYFKLKKLIFLQIVSPPEDIIEQIELKLQIDEITAWLNTMSGGMMNTKK